MMKRRLRSTLTTKRTKARTKIFAFGLLLPIGLLLFIWNVARSTVLLFDNGRKEEQRDALAQETIPFINDDTASSATSTTLRGGGSSSHATTDDSNILVQEEGRPRTPFERLAAEADAKEEAQAKAEAKVINATSKQGIDEPRVEESSVVTIAVAATGPPGANISTSSSHGVVNNSSTSSSAKEDDKKAVSNQTTTQSETNESPSIASSEAEMKATDAVRAAPEPRMLESSIPNNAESTVAVPADEPEGIASSTNSERSLEGGSSPPQNEPADPTPPFENLAAETDNAKEAAEAAAANTTANQKDEDEGASRIEESATKEATTTTTRTPNDNNNAVADTPILLLINCGGDSYTDMEKNVWKADQYFTGGATYTPKPDDLKDIEGTDDGEIYVTERFGTFSYEIPLAAAGRYQVILHQSELYVSKEGERVFDIDVEGTIVADVDLVRLGNGTTFTALTFPPITVEVNDGSLSMEFLKKADNPKVSGIEIRGPFVEANADNRVVVVEDSIVSGNGTSASNFWSPDIESSLSAVSPAVERRRADETDVPRVESTTANGDSTMRATTSTDSSAANGVATGAAGAVTEADVGAPGREHSDVGMKGTHTSSAPIGSTERTTANNTVADTPILLINCGGESYTDIKKNVWKADQYFTGGATYTPKPKDLKDIQGTDDGQIYVTERFGEFSYEIPLLAAGTYQVILHLSELYVSKEGERVFDMNVEGAIFTGVDLVRLGNGTTFTALTFPPIAVQVNDGSLSLEFLKKVDNPKVSGIEIRGPQPALVDAKANAEKGAEAEEPESHFESLAAQANTINHVRDIDFISVGMLGKQNFQDAQERTFGSHPSVRNFFRLSELNDTDSSCHSNLTMPQLENIVDFCKKTDGQSWASLALRTKLFNPNRHTGWLCAQKRPIDGLYNTLQRYKDGESLPSYLLIVDDDSYVKIGGLLQTLVNHHVESEPHILAGCRYNYPQTIQFKFPYGGFGSIFSRKALENLIRPLHCEKGDKDNFTRHACWRLNLDLIGEKRFFREGMSIGDLMYEYSSGLPFTRIDQWINGIGYCMHSDHALGYFVGFYHVGVPEVRLSAEPKDEKLRRQFGYDFMQEVGGQCKYEKMNCNPNSRICHYIKPDQMDSLFAAEQEREERR